MLKNILFRARWRWRRFINRFRRTKTLKNINSVAESFVEDHTSCGPVIDNGNDLVDVLDKKHWEHLDRERDPLADVNEIPSDSIQISKADIQTTGQPSKYPERNIPKATIRPDRIKSSSAKIHQGIQYARDLPPSKKRIRRGK